MAINQDNLRISPATESDIPAMITLIRELAEYEKLTHLCVITEEHLKRALFGPVKFAEALMARAGSQSAGYAIFFHNFSTFLGSPGIYLEDIYVTPSLRGRGIGKKLLVEVGRIAHERGCGRLEWSVLNWNKPAIDFYESLGAKALNEWTMYRLDQSAIANLVKKNS